MASVKLLRPVEHNGEDLVPGDVITDLDEKAAARLVRLGLATREIPTASGEGDSGEDGEEHGLSPEEVAEIANMKKDELLSALKEAEVEATSKETLAQLRAKLTKAWSKPLEPGNGD